MQKSPARAGLFYAQSPEETPVVDLTGFEPGSWAIDLVRELTSPLCTFVLVIDRLHVPPSCARAFDMPWRLFSLP